MKQIGRSAMCAVSGSILSISGRPQGRSLRGHVGDSRKDFLMELYTNVHSIGILVPSFQEFFGNNIVLPNSQHLRRSQTQ